MVRSLHMAGVVAFVSSSASPPLPQGLASLVGQPVFLLAAAGLVRMGHLYETCIEGGAQINQTEVLLSLESHGNLQ